tara:strand:+ start:820 stop:1092 length:273 start_codon:yes stop_codon:yes gene_type:complete
MQKKKVNKINNKNSNNNLIELFSENTPQERQKILTDIDNIMCNILDLEPNDLPWINPNKHEEKWENIMNNLRLVVGKIEYESNKKIRTVH